MHMNPARGVALVIAVVSLLGAACTQTEDDRAAGPQATVGLDSASPDDDADATPDVTPTEEEGGTTLTQESPFTPDDDVVTIATKEPSTLDPMLIGDPGSTLVARQLYEGLTRWDPTGRKVVPAAAGSWKVRDGGATYEFKLVDGATFHDGTPVTAKDFVFAFDRIARRRNASEIAYLLQRVRGFEDVNQVGDTRHLAGLRAPNRRTLVIELTEPDDDCPAVLTHPGLVPLPAKAVTRADEFVHNPIGNGPYAMAQPWDVGGEIYLESFDGAVDPPEVDGLRFVPYPEAAASWLDMLEGELDVAEVPLGQIADAAERFGRRGFKPLMSGYSYGFNLTSLKNRTLRTAISRAIDRTTLAKVVYKGILVQPRGIIPEGVPGFTKDVCKKLCDHAPAIARRLVSELPTGSRRLTLQFPNEAPHGHVARLLKGDLERAGLTVRLRRFKFKEFFDLLQDEAQSVFRLTWLAEYPSPDAYLGALFESDSTDNHTEFSSRVVDDLLARARGERKPAKRLKLYQRAERLILGEVPLAPLGSFRTFWAAQPRVKGIFFDNTGTFDAADVTISRETEEPSPSPSPSG